MPERNGALQGRGQKLPDQAKRKKGDGTKLFFLRLRQLLLATIKQIVLLSFAAKLLVWSVLLLLVQLQQQRRRQARPNKSSKQLLLQQEEEEGRVKFGVG